MMNKTWTIGAVCGALAIGGCGDDGNEPQADTADTSGADISETETSADAVTMTGNIDGTWAMVETQSALVEVLGAVMEQKSVSFYKAVIADNKLTVELCDWLTEDDTKLYTTRMSQNLLSKLGTFERDLTVTANGAGFDFAASQGVTTRGVNLAVPVTDAMPTDGTDERIFDQDEDTKPGISLIIQGTLQGELHVIHRHKAALSGALESDTRIRGLTAWTTDQVILGANPESLASIDPKPVTHPDANRSHFVMVKATDGDDCVALNAKRATLFP
jgi:hypothetical protein